MTTQNETLKKIIGTADQISEDIKKKLQGEAFADPDYLIETALDFHKRIQDLINEADKAGTVKKRYIQKSRIWVENPEIRFIREHSGLFNATVRTKAQIISRQRSDKPNSIAEDFLVAVKHVRRYTQHVFNGGEPKNYGRIENIPILT